jgi:MFS family permease
VAGAARGLRDRFGAVAGVLRARDLRRLQLAWAAYFLDDGITVVALGVWAFGEGGTAAVGLLGLARLLPGAIALPFGAWAADRFSRRRVVTLVFVAITTLDVTLAFALALDAPTPVVIAVVAVASVAAAPYRPAQLALAPLVARSADELVAINVTAGTLEGVVTFVGPALAGLLLLAADPWVVMAASSVAALGGLVSVLRIRVDADGSSRSQAAHEAPVRALLGGFTELRANPDMATFVVCFVAQILVRGLLGVLLVAVSFELVDLGRSGVGWMIAAMGVGAIAGGIAGVTLTGRRRLGGPFAAALALWGAPIAAVGLIAHPAVALGAMAVIGFGNALLDVSGFTMIQRLGRDRALGRVFGVLFTVGIAMGGVGALAAPSLVSRLGLRTVLIAVGAILPLLAVLLSPRFRSIDARSEPVPELLSLLQRVPLLSLLPPTMLEKLATRARFDERAAPAVIVAEGDVGDSFFVIDDGQVQVSVAGVVRRTLDAGAHFGEIALLRGSTRTATVTTTRPTRLLVIDGSDFVDSLSSSSVAFAAGERSSEELLSGDAAIRRG